MIPGMQSLTEDEVESWLASCGMQKAPYDKPDTSFRGFYRHVRIPTGAAQRWGLGSSVVSGCGKFKEALLHFTDWDHYTPDQMAIIRAVLAGYGESRYLIEVPGQVFRSTEGDLLAGLFGLCITFQWSAYLYMESGPTFLAWEGVFMDMWILKRRQKRRLYQWIDPYVGPEG